MQTDLLAIKNIIKAIKLKTCSILSLIIEDKMKYF